MGEEERKRGVQSNHRPEFNNQQQIEPKYIFRLVGLDSGSAERVEDTIQTAA